MIQDRRLRGKRIICAIRTAFAGIQSIINTTFNFVSFYNFKFQKVYVLSQKLKNISITVIHYSVLSHTQLEICLFTSNIKL